MKPLCGGIILLLLMSSCGAPPDDSSSAPDSSLLAGDTFPSGVSFEQLATADRYPGAWLTYSGSYQSQRYSRLDQVNRDNVDQLRLKWVFQMKTVQKVETTPLVVGETMFLTAPPSNAFALDARTGRPFWSYERRIPERISVCCGQVNRGWPFSATASTWALWMPTWSRWTPRPARSSGKQKWPIIGMVTP